MLCSTIFCLTGSVVGKGVVDSVVEAL
jgi:hypothetical protein